MKLSQSELVVLIKKAFDDIKPYLIALSDFGTYNNELLYYENYWAHRIYYNSIKNEPEILENAESYKNNIFKYRFIDLMLLSNNHLSTDINQINEFMNQMKNAFSEFRIVTRQ